MSTTVITPVRYDPPSTVRVRGTLALIAGAGESPRVYARFGARLAADGYAVGIFEVGARDDALAWVAGEQAPRVLVGSDRGAAAALALAASGAGVDGIIVAGLVTGEADSSVAADAARTACPVHLGVLAESASHGTATPEATATVVTPDRRSLAEIAVPVLAVHGGSDEVAPFSDARDVLGAIADLELVETVGGFHDALNDQSHRSVAATVVLWLERLRAGDVGTPIVRTVAR